MKTYLCSYRFGGSEWSFEIVAHDTPEAQARLATIKAWAKLDGELMASIPAAIPGASVWARFTCWLGNLFR